ncbi:MAG: hypothetical protein U0487_00835 [Patescibacteria group bacterium]
MVKADKFTAEVENVAMTQVAWIHDMKDAWPRLDAKFVHGTYKVVDDGGAVFDVGRPFVSGELVDKVALLDGCRSACASDADIRHFRQDQVGRVFGTRVEGRRLAKSSSLQPRGSGDAP